MSHRYVEVFHYVRISQVANYRGALRRNGCWARWSRGSLVGKNRQHQRPRTQQGEELGETSDTLQLVSVGAIA